MWGTTQIFEETFSAEFILKKKLKKNWLVGKIKLGKVYFWKKITKSRSEDWNM